MYTDVPGCRWMYHTASKRTPESCCSKTIFSYNQTLSQPQHREPCISANGPRMDCRERRDRSSAALFCATTEAETPRPSPLQPPLPLAVPEWQRRDRRSIALLEQAAFPKQRSEVRHRQDLDPVLCAAWNRLQADDERIGRIIRVSCLHAKYRRLGSGVSSRVECEVWARMPIA